MKLWLICMSFKGLKDSEDLEDDATNGPSLNDPKIEVSTAHWLGDNLSDSSRESGKQEDLQKVSSMQSDAQAHSVKTVKCYLADHGTVTLHTWHMPAKFGEPPSKEDDFRTLKASRITKWHTVRLNNFSACFAQMLQRYKKHVAVNREHFEQKQFCFHFMHICSYRLNLGTFLSDHVVPNDTKESRKRWPRLFPWFYHPFINLEWLWKTNKNLLLEQSTSLSWFEPGPSQMKEIFHLSQPALSV